MDNGTVKKRDMLAPTKSVNRRATPFWPLMVFVGLIVCSVWITLISIKRGFMYIFKKKKSVKGKVVIVTGAGRGLGRGISIKLAELGAHVACLDINTTNNEETVQLIKKKGGTAEAFTCNIAKSQQVEQFKNEVIAKMGPVDIIVNNAALVMAMAIKEVDYADIRAMFEVNVMGPAFITKAFLSDMMERNSGHIVAISSVGAWSSIPFLNLYCSTKSALSRFFESLRVELDENKNNDIKVSIVHPFFINTSADYTNWFQSFLPVLEEDYVVSKVIDTILYEKESVAVPGPLTLMKVSDAITPAFQYNVIMHFMKDMIQLPTKKMREELPYASIVNDLVSTAR